MCFVHPLTPCSKMIVDLIVAVKACSVSDAFDGHASWVTQSDSRHNRMWQSSVLSKQTPPFPPTYPTILHINRWKGKKKKKQKQYLFMKYPSAHVSVQTHSRGRYKRLLCIILTNLLSNIKNKQKKSMTHCNIPKVRCII